MNYLFKKRNRNKKGKRKTYLKSHRRKKIQTKFHICKYYNLKKLKKSIY